MATKEDILEQIVEEYLISKGYFVRHNLKFLPSREHSDYNRREDVNHSDIDVLGFNPLKRGADRVWAVSCKSWQFGFDPKYIIRLIDEKRKLSGRPAWKSFRELCSPKWSIAFTDAVLAATGSSKFTYVTAVAMLKGSDSAWTTHSPFVKALGGNPLKIITFQQMVDEIQAGLTYTLAGSEVGRLLQMFRVSGLVGPTRSHRSTLV